VAKIFLYKNASHDHNFAKILEKLFLPFGGPKGFNALNLGGNFTFFVFEKPIPSIQNTRNT